MTSQTSNMLVLYATAEMAAALQRGSTKKKTRSPVDQAVGEKIRRRRGEIGLSQEQLAAKLNIASEQVERYEVGDLRVGAVRLARLAKMLEVKPAFFFDDLPHIASLAGALSQDAAPLVAAMQFASETPGGVNERIRRNADLAEETSDRIIAAKRPHFGSGGLQDANSAHPSDAISKQLSTKAFFDQHFRASVERFYPSSRLFSIFFPLDSILVEPSGKFFASGEALISVPTETRSGAKVAASLSLPVRVSGNVNSARMSFETAELAPIESHHPPDLAQRLRAPHSRRRSRSAA